MELRDYVAALRRYWTTWLGVTLVALAVALVAVVSATPTYSARATVFVAAASMEGPSGAQFIRQRVPSYPDVARSESVLGPVIEAQGLDLTVAELRARVTADNPLETSQIDITVTDPDPVRAAAIANAIGDQFRQTVEDLERPADGASPVGLTVTDPANAPSSPVAPRPALFLGLGLVVGLALGAAVAVVRSRVDTRVHTEDDVRAAWGPDAAEPAVFTAARGRREAGHFAGHPAALVARRLAAAAGNVPVKAVVLGLAPGDDNLVARTFADQVSAVLNDGAVPALVTGPVGVPARTARAAAVQLATATPGVPLPEWRRIAERYDGVIVVTESGRAEAADLREVRAILAATGTRLLAVVLLPRNSVRTKAVALGSTGVRQARVGQNLARPRDKAAAGEMLPAGEKVAAGEG